MKKLFRNRKPYIHVYNTHFNEKQAAFIVVLQGGREVEKKGERERGREGRGKGRLTSFSEMCCARPRTMMVLLGGMLR